MDADSRRQKHRENVLLSLDAAIEGMNLAEEISSHTPAKAIFGTVSALLKMIKVYLLLFCGDGLWFTHIQDSMSNKTDYVELGLACTSVCEALQRGMNGKRKRDLSQPVRKAIKELTTWVKPIMHGLDSSLTGFLDRRTVMEIQEKVTEKSKRNLASRLVYAKSDKDAIATWRSDLNRILHVFNVHSGFFRFTVADCSHSGRADHEDSYDGFGSPSWHADRSGRYQRPTSLRKCNFPSTDNRMLTIS